MREADRLGEIAVAVGEELDPPSPPVAFDQASMTKTSLTPVTTMASTPFALISAALFDVAGQVVAVAGRREGAGHGDEHDLAALEEVVGRLRLPVRRPS